MAQWVRLAAALSVVFCSQLALATPVNDVTGSLETLPLTRLQSYHNFVVNDGKLYLAHGNSQAMPSMLPVELPQEPLGMACAPIEPNETPSAGRQPYRIRFDGQWSSDTWRLENGTILALFSQRTEDGYLATVMAGDDASDLHEVLRFACASAARSLVYYQNDLYFLLKDGISATQGSSQPMALLRLDGEYFSVPEPATLALVVAGGLGLLRRTKRGRK